MRQHWLNIPNSSEACDQPMREPWLTMTIVPGIVSLVPEVTMSDWSVMRVIWRPQPTAHSGLLYQKCPKILQLAHDNILCDLCAKLMISHTVEIDNYHEWLCNATLIVWSINSLLNRLDYESSNSSTLLNQDDKSKWAMWKIDWLIDWRREYLMVVWQVARSRYCDIITIKQPKLSINESINQRLNSDWLFDWLILWLIDKIKLISSHHLHDTLELFFQCFDATGFVTKFHIKRIFCLFWLIDRLIARLIVWLIVWLIVGLSDWHFQSLIHFE